MAATKVNTEQLLAPLATDNPQLRGRMGKEIAASVLRGDIDAREAADYILARLVRKAQSAEESS